MSPDNWCKDSVGIREVEKADGKIEPDSDKITESNVDIGRKTRCEGTEGPGSVGDVAVITSTTFVAKDMLQRVVALSKEKSRQIFPKALVRRVPPCRGIAVSRKYKKALSWWHVNARDKQRIRIKTGSLIPPAPRRPAAPDPSSVARNLPKADWQSMGRWAEGSGRRGGREYRFGASWNRGMEDACVGAAGFFRPAVFWGDGARSVQRERLLHDMEIAACVAAGCCEAQREPGTRVWYYHYFSLSTTRAEVIHAELFPRPRPPIVTWPRHLIGSVQAPF
ncbi:hypothetical protein K438DRAFT_1792263 [Mycena galopus ATCC 62051]|nr:hypothetical protein K438DRAFT_1792263 [Mycena galopus ATCC 62051]